MTPDQIVDDRQRLVADAISEIPASSSGSMEFVATTVGMKIGRRLIDKIAETAVDALRDHLASRPQPRKATGEGWWVQPKWVVNPAYPAELILTIGGAGLGCVYLRDGTWRGLVFREGATSLPGVVEPYFPTREGAQAALIAAVRPYPVSVSPAAAEGWQTIETAPKDGTRVLLWMVHENRKWGEADEWEAPVVAYWTDHNNGGWVWHGMAGKPTHWMPSPAAPPSPAQEQE